MSEVCLYLKVCSSHIIFFLGVGESTSEFHYFYLCYLSVDDFRYNLSYVYFHEYYLSITLIYLCDNSIEPS